MKKLLPAALAIAFITIVSVTSTAQVTKGKTRLAKTSQIMRGFVRPNYSTIRQGTEKLPANKKEWHALATSAALLNEAGYLLMDDGRCPDSDWASAAKALRTGTAEILKSVESKDADRMAEAFKVVTQSCVSCHKVHKE